MANTPGGRPKKVMGVYDRPEGADQPRRKTGAIAMAVVIVLALIVLFFVARHFHWF